MMRMMRETPGRPERTRRRVRRLDGWGGESMLGDDAELEETMI
jgi:hypothetical protein